MKSNQYRNDRLDFLSTFIFTSILSVFGVLFFSIHKATASQIEGRSLCAVPTFSVDSLFSGHYLDSLNLHYADNFPFREGFVSWSMSLKSWRGYQSSEVTFYAGALDMDAGIEQDSFGNGLNDGGIADSMVMKNDGNIEDVGKLSRGLLIYEGMAMQMFGGGRGSAKYASAAMNSVLAKLPEGVQMYVGVTPTHGEFYLPSGYSKNYNSERKNIDTLYAYLDPRIKTIDICLELHKHKDEYIFFNTDHHWTGTGAYYAYVALCKAAGFEAVPLSQMQTKAIPGFLGSLYRSTRDARLRDNPDSVVYHKIPNQYQAYSLYGLGYANKRKTSLYVEGAKGGNAYGVFLGGDIPAMCIETTNKNGRVALMIKNSYGNALAPFLPANYERVFVIDYRYFKSNLIDFIKKNGVTDFIVFHNSFSANTSSHIDMMKSTVSGRPADIIAAKVEPVVPPAPKVDTSKVDSSKAKVN
jgi:hypothetical protein